MMRWWKNKMVLFSLCLELLFLGCVSTGERVKAATGEASIDGFVVEADRVVGSGMFASLVNQETSTNDAKPMLRIQYQTATIYGMKLTKQFDSPKGPVTVVMKAKGPVTVQGMTVDISAISFKGACVNASEKIPELGMDDVVMVAHFMDNQDSSLSKLSLETVSGNMGLERPGKLQILQDLSLLPVNLLKQEIEKVSSGHLPLMCGDGTKTGLSGGGDSLKGIIDKVKNPLGQILNPLDPVLTPLDPILNPLDPILNPLEPVLTELDPALKPLGPVLKPIEPILKPVEPVLKPLDPVLKQVKPVLKPLDPVLKPAKPVLKPLEPVLKPLDPVLKPIDPILKTADPVTPEPVPGSSGDTGKTKPIIPTTCDKIKNTNGVITKELGLDLVNEAIDKKITLSKVCQSDSSLTAELTGWESSLFKSLELVNLLGNIIVTDPLQQLHKMRDKISAEKDGAVIYKP